MHITNISQNWGSVVTFNDPSEFFIQHFNYWRSMLYSRKLLIFKGMCFDNKDYIRFGSKFGKLWTKEEYDLNTEIVLPITVKDTILETTTYSNITNYKMNLAPMPWHTDIPNRTVDPYPIRSLWNISNPAPEYGITSWLNLEDGLTSLDDGLLSTANNIQIVMQGNYCMAPSGTNMNTVDFIKTHPITGKKSIRLDWYNDPEVNCDDAWIRSVIVDGVEVEDCKQVLLPYFNVLESNKDLIYDHVWDELDIAIYDNWSLVHKRNTLKPLNKLSRTFLRTTINHQTSIEYAAYQAEMNKLFGA